MRDSRAASAAEKRRIVELTFIPNARATRVARAEGVNSHQVFRCRQDYPAGHLQGAECISTALLPVMVSVENK